MFGLWFRFGMAQGVNRLPKYLARLVSNIIPEIGTGPITFTRTSAILDQTADGLKSIPSGAPSFTGLRRVENLITISAKFTALAANPSGSCAINGSTVTFGANAGDAVAQGTSGYAFTAGQIVRVSATLSGTGVVRLGLTNPSSGGLRPQQDITLTSAPRRYTSNAFTLLSTGTLSDAILQNGSGGLASSCTAIDLQYEIVSGQANQNPSDYIQTFGSAVTKWFDYANPNTVAGNGVVTDSGIRTPVYTTKGILVEPASTNLFLNSQAAVTQNIAVTAQTYTLSFYGTGNIVRSGVSTGTLTGTGANNRVSVTFTPTAGTLTLTVSGTCSNVQFETGIFVTTPIITLGTSVTRNATVLSNPIGDVPAGQKTISGVWTPNQSISTALAADFVQWSSYTDASNEVSLRYNGTTLTHRKRIAGVNYDATIAMTVVAGTEYKWDMIINADNTTQVKLNGVSGTGNANTTADVFGTTFQIGSGNNLLQALGNHKDIQIFDRIF